MDSLVELQIETDQTGESDIEFLSAESSRVEDGEASVQDCLMLSEGTKMANNDVSSDQNQKENTVESKRLGSSELPNGNGIQKSGENPAPPSDVTKPVANQAVKAGKKGLPALLPLQHGLVSNGEARAPRQAALKSVEKMKAMAKQVNSESADSDDQDVTILDIAQGASDASVSAANIQKISDPSLDVCRSCQKIQCLMFKSVGKYSKKVLKFCNMNCVRAFFNSAVLHCSYAKADVEEEEKSSNNHIVVEPDIEIQTLGDEFQMETDEANTSVCSSGPTNASHLEDIEKALEQSLICAGCKKCLVGQSDPIQWEAMDFCSDNCLKSYVKAICFHCNQCGSQVNEQSLGKLCVRFGPVIRQFCSSDCLEKFKARHKLCTQCQVNMTEKDKVYCSTACHDLSRRLTSRVQYFGQRKCAVCSVHKSIKFEIVMGRQSFWICGKPCRNAFRFANNMTTLTCSICARYFDVRATPRHLARCTGKLAANDVMWFCTSTCFATHLYRKRKIELCSRCHVKKYNVDMIRKTAKAPTEVDSLFCSLFCYNYNQYPANVRKRFEVAVAKSATVQNSTAATVAATAVQPVAQLAAQPAQPTVTTLASVPPPQIASVAATLAKSMIVFNNMPPQQPISAPPVSTVNQSAPTTGAFLPIEVQHKIITLPPKPKEMKNKAVWCRPVGKVDEPAHKTVATETNIAAEKTKEQNSNASTKEIVYVPIPIPVPIYVPVPMAMYSVPAPFPVGFPVPYPTPVILPFATDDVQAILSALEESEADEILREEQEAERLVVEPLIFEHSEGEQLDDSVKTETLEEGDLAAMETLQMESFTVEPLLDEEFSLTEANAGAQACDGTEGATEGIKETALEASEQKVDGATKETGQTKTLEVIAGGKGVSKAQGELAQKGYFVSGKDIEKLIPSYSLTPSLSKSRKRSNSASRAQPPSKRLKAASERSASDTDDPTSESNKERLNEDVGLKAWTAWLDIKKRQKATPEIENSSDDVNEKLIEFTKSVRKPDYSPYRPDTLLYLLLGIAPTLEMGKKMKNIFVDSAFTLFQDELDKHLKPFYEKAVQVIRGEDQSVLLTCLTESHLWGCRQLGSHSPLVLIFTMLYFNTKYFRLYTVEDHEKLSFANIEKMPVKTNGDANGPKTFSRAFLLQYNPNKDDQSTGSASSNGSDLKIRQNQDTPSQCPVRLYSFYLSKCPESVKTGRNAFYLMPLENETPDSLWYSSQPVPREVLARMLHRVMLIEDVLRNLCISKSTA